MIERINALSGWGSISTRILKNTTRLKKLYQCPFGLGLHFYAILNDRPDCYPYNVSMPFRAKAPFLLVRRELTMENYKEYQCPFGLMLHFYDNFIADACKANDLYQCPFGLGLHFYGTPSKT